jgi:hypothetical protein
MSTRGPGSSPDSAIRNDAAGNFARTSLQFYPGTVDKARCTAQIRCNRSTKVSGAVIIGVECSYLYAIEQIGQNLFGALAEIWRAKDGVR